VAADWQRRIQKAWLRRFGEFWAAFRENLITICISVPQFRFSGTCPPLLPVIYAHEYKQHVVQKRCDPLIFILTLFTSNSQRLRRRDQTFEFRRVGHDHTGISLKRLVFGRPFVKRWPCAIRRSSSPVCPVLFCPVCL